MADRVTVRGLDKLRELDENFRRIEELHGPKAVVRTVNALRNRATAATVTKVWNESRYLNVVNSRGNKVRSGIKRRHISRRVFSSRAKLHRPYSSIVAYIKPIPAIALAERVDKRAGVANYKVQKISRKTGPRRKSSRLGGVKVGGRVLPNAFVQVVRRGQQVHIFQRKQKGTWREGHYGWAYSPGSSQTHARLPYDVVKFDLSVPFRKHFYPTIEKVVKERWDKEYARNLGHIAGKDLGNRIY